MIRQLSSFSSTTASSSSANSGAPQLADFCQYIPLRLSSNERALLRVLESALHVSEYTDHVDVASNRRGAKARRILDGIIEACEISTGLAIASGNESSMLSMLSMQPEPEGKTQKKSKKFKKKLGLQRRGKKTVALPPTTTSLASQEPRDNAIFFQTLFEIGRRNKVLNPNQMRTTYGKLMYLMQDAQNPTVARSLGMSLYKDLVLVGPYLKEHDCTDLLIDERLEGATQYITDQGNNGTKLSREEIEERVAEKRSLFEQLVKGYSSKSKLSEDDLRRVIESISDAVAYVELNVRPVQLILKMLEDNFDPQKPENPYSLQLRASSRYSSSSYSRYGFSAFSSSSGGPTLSHSHSTQYTFVWQSLTLWRKVQWSMHRLWVAADADLLSTKTSYHLYNTGQGLNRVQSCPRVGKIMSSLLGQTQQEAGSPWVGLSVIHLGDRDVPNALVFIDKYTQIPRFLNPLVSFLQGLDELVQDPTMNEYVEKQFGSTADLKMTVLSDFFKHGFDGSGDDGGSCIDGRLTSAWNWTSRIAKKPYYHAFMLSGFQGFDGDGFS